MTTTAARRPVLVVDDDAELRGTIVEYLTARNFTVIEVENGLEALLALKRSRPTAVVLDLMMPRLGGLEALKHIRKFDPSITVVVVSGQPDTDLLAHARAEGASVVLSKPVDFERLEAALRGPAASARQAPAPKARRPDDARPAAADVLVVDDEPEIRATLEEFLRRKGFRIRAAGDGEAALRAIREAPPDVVLLDFHMPRLGGIEALIAIRAVAPETKVIMVSGLDDADQARLTMAHGAADFVVKPVDFAYLAQSIETALLWKGLGPA